MRKGTEMRPVLKLFFFCSLHLWVFLAQVKLTIVLFYCTSLGSGSAIGSSFSAASASSAGLGSSGLGSSGFSGGGGILAPMLENKGRKEEQVRTHTALVTFAMQSSHHNTTLNLISKFLTSLWT